MYSNVSTIRSNRYPLMGLGCACPGPVGGLGKEANVGWEATMPPGQAAIYNMVKRLQERLRRLGITQARPMRLADARAALMRALPGGIAGGFTVGAETAARLVAQYLLAATIKLVEVGALVGTLERQAARSPQSAAAAARLISVAGTGMSKIDTVLRAFESGRSSTSGLGFFFLVPFMNVGGLALAGGAIGALIYFFSETVEEEYARARGIADATCASLRAQGQDCDWEAEFRGALRQVQNSGIDDVIANGARNLGEGLSAPFKILIVGGAVLVGGYALFTFWPAIAGFTGRTRAALKAREAARVTPNRRKKRRGSRRRRRRG